MSQIVETGRKVAGTRTGRIAAVTAGLAAAGAVAGGAVAATISLVWSVFHGGFPSVRAGVEILSISAFFGAAVGAVLGPAAAWLLLRHVPVGRAIAATALGTVAGGVAALAFRGWPIFWLPLVGFAAGAVAARVFTPKRPARAVLPPAG
jgi:hypothetical protein